MAPLNNGRRYARREEAVERKEARSARTDTDQIKVLDRRLGEAAGARRERLRLVRAIEVAYEKDESKKRRKKKDESKSDT